MSVLLGSMYDTGHLVPGELLLGGGPTNLLLTVGINLGMLVLFLGTVLSMSGNLVRIRWERPTRQEAEGDGPEAEPAN